MHFINLNRENLARFGIFCRNDSSVSYVNGSFFLCDFATFYCFCNLSGIFPSREALRKKFNIVLPSFYYSWVKFTHCYAPDYQWSLSCVFLKGFLIFPYFIISRPQMFLWAFFLISNEKSVLQLHTVNFVR